MKRYVFCLVAALVFLVSQAVAAQTIASYEMQVFAPGVNTVTGSPVQRNTYLPSVITCGQPKIPTPTGSVANPTRFAFADPADATKDCVGTLASVLLPALPNAPGYLATLTVTDNLGQTSPRSAASNPFDRQGIPSVLTGLRVVQ